MFDILILTLLYRWFGIAFPFHREGFGGEWLDEDGDVPLCERGRGRKPSRLCGCVCRSLSRAYLCLSFQRLAAGLIANCCRRVVHKWSTDVNRALGWFRCFIATSSVSVLWNQKKYGATWDWTRDLRVMREGDFYTFRHYPSSIRTMVKGEGIGCNRILRVGAGANGGELHRGCTAKVRKKVSVVFLLRDVR